MQHLHFLSYAALPVTRTQLCEFGLDLVHKIGCHGNALRDCKKVISFIYSHRGPLNYTNPANLVKIGPVDVEETAYGICFGVWTIGLIKLKFRSTDRHLKRDTYKHVYEPCIETG